MLELAVVAGVISTSLFALSALPMVVKAVVSKDLASYSRGNLVLVNAGNLVHTVYVLSLPPGPLWVLHAFYVASSLVMLVWHLRFGGATDRESRSCRTPSAREPLAPATSTP